MYYVIANRDSRSYDRDYDINAIDSIFENDVYYDTQDIMRDIGYSAGIDANDFIYHEMSYYRFESACKDAIDTSLLEHIISKNGACEYYRTYTVIDLKKQYGNDTNISSHQIDDEIQNESSIYNDKYVEIFKQLVEIEIENKIAKRLETVRKRQEYRHQEEYNKYLELKKKYEGG